MRYLIAGLLLVLFQPVDALELFAGVGRCGVDVATVCDEGTVVNFRVSQKWDTAVPWLKVEWVILDHISHYDAGEEVKLSGQKLKGSGQINGTFIGLRVEW